jgi:predicted TPR repeat methyltransferase
MAHSISAFRLSLLINEGFSMFAHALPRFFGGTIQFMSRRAHPEPRVPWLFMLPRDIGLFIQGARTDAKITRLQQDESNSATFETVYTESADPWASASPRYRYQGLKYDKLIGLLPQRHFANALDLGCGLGLLSQKLAKRAERVLGIDIATAALDHARRRATGLSNLEFAPGDILSLPVSLNGQFDLVVIADVLYYLSPLDEMVLTSVVRRIADLLSVGGTCLLANHFFFSADKDSKVSRKIHRAFSDSPRFAVMSEHRRAFFLATLYSERSQLISA